MSIGVFERVLENWLDKSIETSYQIPFCYLLSNEGYQVVHLTRHSAMEMGKDVIAIDAEGIPCAFQLKGSEGPRVTMSQWDKIHSQLLKLITHKIKHHALPESARWRTFLVTNGGIDEEVERAIIDFNDGWASTGLPYKLEVMSRTNLLEMAKRLKEGLWPTELKNVQSLLEMFLIDGRSALPKDKLSKLLGQIYRIEDVEALSKNRAIRAISSGAVVTSISLSNFEVQGNHWAQLQGWTMFLAYTYALAERARLSRSDIANETFIAKQTILNVLANLVDEIKEKKEWSAGDPIFDKPFQPARLTLLKALVSINALHRRSRNAVDVDLDNFEREFCLNESTPVFLWGEAAVIQLLAIFWHRRRLDVSPRSEFLLYSIIRQVTEANALRSDKIPYAPPYVELEAVLSQLLKLDDESNSPEGYGSTFTLEGVLHLFVRRLWKNPVRQTWPEITHLSFASVVHSETWKHYLWMNSDSIHVNTYPPHTKDWKELLSEAEECAGVDVPSMFKDDPIFYLMFLIVYPHRTNSSGMRWLDTRIKELC